MLPRARWLVGALGLLVVLPCGAVQITAETGFVPSGISPSGYLIGSPGSATASSGTVESAFAGPDGVFEAAALGNDAGTFSSVAYVTSLLSAWSAEPLTGLYARYEYKQEVANTTGLPLLYTYTMSLAAGTIDAGYDPLYPPTSGDVWAGYLLELFWDGSLVYKSAIELDASGALVVVNPITGALANTGTFWQYTWPAQSLTATLGVLPAGALAELTYRVTTYANVDGGAAPYDELWIGGATFFDPAGLSANVLAAAPAGAVNAPAPVVLLLAGAVAAARLRSKRTRFAQSAR